MVEVEFVYSQSQRVLRGAGLQDFCKLQNDGFSASSALSAQSNFSAFLPAVLEIQNYSQDLETYTRQQASEVSIIQWYHLYWQSLESFDRAPHNVSTRVLAWYQRQRDTLYDKSFLLRMPLV